MEDDKKNCCGLHKVGRVGRAVIIGCGIFAILVIGFSLGAGFNHERGDRFGESSYRFEGGCGRHNDRGGERFDNRQNIESGCGMRATDNIPATGVNFERQVNQNNIQAIPSPENNPVSPITETTVATGTVILK
jgi:hypothetical protein